MHQDYLEALKNKNMNNEITHFYNVTPYFFRCKFDTMNIFKNF